MTLRANLLKALIIIFLLGLNVVGFGQQPKPGLLWKISGKGLETPSYLFGTIHLTDKRVFNFGDSLYKALETSAGYAMELNPDSLMFYYFQEEKESKPSPYLVDIVSREKFAVARKKLKREFGKPAEKVTVKDLKSYFNEWVYMLNKQESMQTFMDAFLYNVVRRQGKWVGGIEDVQDQLNIDDDQNDKETAIYYLNDFINGNKESKRTLEEMIKRYTSNDLSQIEELSESGSEFQKEVVLLRRNIKMAGRIDSLANVRNTFFAIGSAHLPGDSGVISLLRKRGYTLTPVISSKTIHADDYKFQQKELPWVTVKSKTGLYTVEMPGEPQNNIFDQDEIDFKMYADVPTNLYYFTMGIVGRPISNVDSLLRALVKNIDKKAVISGIKEIRQDSIDGMECFAKSQKIYYQIRMFHKSSAFYLAMVGTLNIGAGLPPEADKFFRSFVMNPNPTNLSRESNRIYRPELGFTIRFPMKPTLKKGTIPDENWISNHYTAIDFQNDIFYQCIVRDIDKGFYQSGDSVSFEVYKEKIKNEHKLLSSRDTVLQGYPGINLEFDMQEEGSLYYNRIFNFHRGNRMYVLIVTTSQKEKNRLSIDSFFNSFDMINVKNSEWNTQSSPDGSFKTWGCSLIESYRSKTDTSESKIPYWTIYDSMAPMTFFIRKEAYPKYFWAKDDTTLLREASNNIKSYGDSLLSYRLVKNGRSKGVEFIVDIPANHNVKKFRILLVGDTLYTVFGIGAREFLEKPDYIRVFEDFRSENDTARSKLFINKRKELLAALHSTDSIEFADAKAALESNSFKKEDLPDLHKALLESYADTAEYYTTSEKLFEVVSSVQDRSTIDFVRKQYPRLNLIQEDLKYEMLALLAKYRTEESYALLNDLLQKDLPKSGTSYKLFNAFYDSLSMARRFFPQLLNYLGDPHAGSGILRLTETMIDSNVLDRNILVENKSKFLSAASNFLLKLKEDDEAAELYDGGRLIRLIGKIDQPDANAMLRKFLVQKGDWIRYHAVTALVRNKQTVDDKVLNELAANAEIRMALYDELSSLKKESLFPKQYYTQRYFAESELRMIAGDEFEVKNMTYLGERTTSFMGEKRKFHLFKVELDYGDEPYSRLGVAGPYLINSKKVEMSSDAAGVHYQEEFKSNDINKLFRAYIANLEKITLGEPMPDVEVRK